jgi:2-polyprenyl-3-methyl-5-hydroxy-6-metoxy-1,4-benzoquinol methylase
MDLKSHWEKVYRTKQESEVSWYQQTPAESLAFIRQFVAPGSGSVIDIGGGNGLLVDHLLSLGYTDITVLDISEMALQAAKLRLGENAKRVNWIVGDVMTLDTGRQYDCWHDRATFHFLTSTQEIENYITLAGKHLKNDGKLIIGTFSTHGPAQCSGLPVKQYNEKSLSEILQQRFTKLKCITADHLTPLKTIQNFLFCSFQKLSY